mmetsp:Transcript_12904/g.54116  ORF Transcript_12904/g.54116 Transcript_12904/m.54116 type:complete len:251 (-) Transcript_12904:115-867(-)
MSTKKSLLILMSPLFVGARLFRLRRRRSDFRRLLRARARLPRAFLRLLLREAPSFLLRLRDRRALLLLRLPLLDLVLQLEQAEDPEQEARDEPNELPGTSFLVLDVVRLEHGDELRGHRAGHLLELLSVAVQLVRGERLDVGLLRHRPERLHVHAHEMHLLVLGRLGQRIEVRRHVLRGRGPARDELHEHEILLPRLPEHLGVFLFRVARHDSAERHHLARAARTPSNRHLRVDELPISDRCFSLFNSVI